MIKKVAIIGPQNCGKTTCWHHIGYELKSKTRVIGMGAEIARTMMEMTTLGLLGQLTLLHRQIEQELRLEQWYDKIVTDRSVFDTIAYAGQIYEENKMSLFDYHMIRKFVFYWSTIHPYAAIIYLKPLPIEDDPQRGKDVLRRQSQMNRMFDILLLELKRRFSMMTSPETKLYEIDVNNKKERSKQVYELVEEILFHEDK